MVGYILKMLGYVLVYVCTMVVRMQITKARVLPLVDGDR